MNFRMLTLLVIALCTGSTGLSAEPAKVSLQAYPSKIELTGAGAHARLVFQQVEGNEVGGQVVEGLQIRSPMKAWRATATVASSPRKMVKQN